jgi:hypothetical protein
MTFFKTITDCWRVQEDQYKDLLTRFGLWRLTLQPTIIKLYGDGQFYWWREPEYSKKAHRPVASYWQTLSLNVVLSTPSLSSIRTQIVSGDRHWLHR